MKIYFVANARMPSEKANGIHIAKVCEALIECGHDVTLVVPSRASAASLKEFYGLRVEVPVVRLWSLVFGEYERLGFALMGFSFMLSYLAYLLPKKWAGEKVTIYTVDIDSFSHTLLPLAGVTIAEFHSPKRSTFLARFFFKHARVVATNPLIADELKKTFSAESMVEPNGVDESVFSAPHAVVENKALYVGRFYKWKGLEVLGPASTALKERDISALALGGTKEEFERVFGNAGALEFAECPPVEVPHWLAKAGVLLIIGTKKNDDSYRYTTPMKAFEYLASGKPIVASDTPALRSFVPADLVTYVAPDDATALANAIEDVLAKPHDGARGIVFAREHTWRKRAERIAAQYFT